MNSSNLSGHRWPALFALFAVCILLQAAPQAPLQEEERALTRMEQADAPFAIGAPMFVKIVPRGKLWDQSDFQGALLKFQKNEKALKKLTQAQEAIVATPIAERTQAQQDEFDDNRQRIAFIEVAQVALAKQYAQRASQVGETLFSEWKLPNVLPSSGIGSGTGQLAFKAP